MFDHQRDQLVICVCALREAKLAVDGLARAQQLARLHLHLFEQRAKPFFRQRLCVIIDFLKWNAALTEQPVKLSTFRSSRFFVNGYFIFHLCRFSLREDAAHARGFRDAVDGQDVRARAHVRVISLSRLVDGAKGRLHRQLKTFVDLALRPEV
jgi:hypothetical protein